LSNQHTRSLIQAYGTRIYSDRKLNIDLHESPIFSHELELRSGCPISVQYLQEYIPLGISHGRELAIHTDRPFSKSQQHQPWCFEVKDVVSFYWISGERSIYYELGTSGNDSLLTFWFLHIFLPLYFTIEDKYDFLHAGAVEVDDKPILFIAPSMGGKSTMTDCFIKQGHTLISDDKVATYYDDDKFFSVPSHPYHRPYRQYEDLGYHISNYSRDAKPIHAFYSLDSASKDAEIIISEIIGYKKFEILLPAYLYSFPFLKPMRLKYLSKMLDFIALYRVHVPWDIKRLDEVHDAICQHSISKL